MLKQISFIKLLTFFALFFEVLFVIDQCYLEEMEVKANIIYIMTAKDKENCYVSLKNIHPIDEPIMSLKAKEEEKEFYIHGNKVICEEFSGNDEIASLYLSMSKIFNHPSTVEVITQKSDQFYQTPYLVNHKFVLLHSFYMILILIKIFEGKFKFPKYFIVFVNLGLIYIGIGEYLEIERKVKFQYFNESLVFEIVDSE